ncbi:MAG: sensor histidine kinase, partial [Pseudomonadota bacterium]
GQLAAGINHELNQPLAAIRAYAENARRFLALSRFNQTDANLEQIVELTHRMADISAQLRQFSRKSSEHQENIAVQSCIEYALRLFHSRLRDSQVTVEQQLPEATLWVKGDLVRLEQVIVNLISNALQAMTDTFAPRLIVSVATDEANVHINIIDNGPGIDSAHINQIFAPFFTTKAPGNGLGLGLSISSRIMEDLGGKLKACNHPSGGAKFSIILPLAMAPDTSMEHLSHA